MSPEVPPLFDPLLDGLDWLVVLGVALGDGEDVFVGCVEVEDECELELLVVVSSLFALHFLRCLDDRLELALLFGVFGAFGEESSLWCGTRRWRTRRWAFKAFGTLSCKVEA